MRTIAAGATYFVLVFACGFALGTLRVLLLVPRIGERWAELAELPLMMLISLWAARTVARRMRVAHHSRALLLMGGVGLALLLAAELGVALGLRGGSISDYLASRDPLSGAAYLLALGVFAFAPWLTARRIVDRR